MAKIEDYYENIRRDHEKNAQRINELAESLLNSDTSVEAAKAELNGIYQTLVSFVAKVKENSVAYNLIKKWDAWQEIEKLIDQMSL